MTQQLCVRLLFILPFVTISGGLVSNVMGVERSVQRGLAHPCIAKAICQGIPSGWTRSSSLICGAAQVMRTWQQKESVSAIKKAGGRVTYDYEMLLSGPIRPRSSPPGPAWLRRLVGDGLFAEVEVVAFSQASSVTDADLTHLGSLKQLKGLHFSHASVTDAGLVHLAGLTQLRSLALIGMPVTDKGLGHLRSLTELRSLSLNGTKVTDAGLVHLNAMSHLESLDLCGAQITDVGLEHLKGFTFSSLDLSCTQVTDEGEAKLWQVSSRRASQ